MITVEALHATCLYADFLLGLFLAPEDDFQVTVRRHFSE
jgi:hypothetical protein